jgi:hypothetical protein
VGVELLAEPHAAQIAGVLGCWDRMLVFGTLPKICFAGGMTSFPFERKIRIFDYPKFAEPFRNRIRENAEKDGGRSGDRDRVHPKWLRRLSATSERPTVSSLFVSA